MPHPPNHQPKPHWTALCQICGAALWVIVRRPKAKHEKEVKLCTRCYDDDLALDKTFGRGQEHREG